MQKIRYGLILLWMLLCSVTSAAADVSIGIGLPNVSIGINLPLFPQLVPVPGYPVYYAPQVDGNYFFYDGMYWVYQDDNWYASSWYNGPWGVVEPEVVPLFVLRIPVRYYQQPPVYFRGWQSNAPPRWGNHWGHGWEQRRRGWDRWQRGSAPARAPLPIYQRRYSGDRYPRLEQQQTLRRQSYRYQPHDKVVRQSFQRQQGERASAPAQRGRHQAPQMRNPRQQQRDVQRSMPPQHGGQAGQRTQPQQRPPQQRSPASHEQRQQQPGGAQQRGGPQQRGPASHEQRQQPGAAQRGQQAPRLQGRGQGPQDRGRAQAPDRGRGQDQKKEEGRGGGRNN